METLLIFEFKKLGPSRNAMKKYNYKLGFI